MHLDDWGLLVGGILLLIITAEDLSTGRATLFFRTVTQSEDGYLYWWAIVQQLMLAVACLVGVVVLLFAHHSR